MAYTDPNGSLRNKKFLRCDYHRDHGHETDRCRSLKFLVEKMIKMGHPKRYIREPDDGVDQGKLRTKSQLAWQSYQNPDPP